MSLKSRSDGLEQKLILIPQQKTSFCALNTKITIYSSHPSIFAFLYVLLRYKLRSRTGNPVTGYTSGMFRGITNKSWASTRFTMRTTRNAD
jgi:hypothetical protein